MISTKSFHRLQINASARLPCIQKSRILGLGLRVGIVKSDVEVKVVREDSVYAFRVLAPLPFPLKEKDIVLKS